MTPTTAQGDFAPCGKSAPRASAVAKLQSRVARCSAHTGMVRPQRLCARAVVYDEDECVCGGHVAVRRGDKRISLWPTIVSLTTFSAQSASAWPSSGGVRLANGCQRPLSETPNSKRAP
jgi:hypothetical protein